MLSSCCIVVSSFIRQLSFSITRSFARRVRMSNLYMVVRGHTMAINCFASEGEIVFVAHMSRMIEVNGVAMDARCPALVGRRTSNFNVVEVGFSATASTLTRRRCFRAVLSYRVSPALNTCSERSANHQCRFGDAKSRLSGIERACGERKFDRAL